MNSFMSPIPAHGKCSASVENPKRFSLSSVGEDGRIKAVGEQHCAKENRVASALPNGESATTGLRS